MCACGYRKVRITRRDLFLTDRIQHTSIQKGKGKREEGLDPGERKAYGRSVALRKQRAGEGSASRGRN